MAERSEKNSEINHDGDCVKNEGKSGRKRRLPLSLKRTRIKNKKCGQQATDIAPDDICNKTITRNLECINQNICSVCQVQIACGSSQGDTCSQCRVETSGNLCFFSNL